MADSKISALTAVGTPAGTDEFAVNQGGASKKLTLTQVQTFAGTGAYAAKCWVASTQSSTTIQQSHNVASVADTGAGISTVTIATDFAAATYCVVVGAEHNSASGTTQTYNIDNGGRAVGSYVIQSWQVDGTEVLTDPSASWFSVAFGAQ